MGQGVVEPDQYIILGRVGAPYGVKGFVHIQSFAEVPDSLFDYDPWYLKTRQGWQPIEVLEARDHGQGFVARLQGCADRDAAAKFTNLEIGVLKSNLPDLPQGDYYWDDLVGLKVLNETGEELGIVSHLFETGANDVLVVKGENKEYLIPYLPGTYITKVDLDLKELHVRWDPEF